MTLHEDLLQLPFTWKRPRLVFVNSMSDLFHRGRAARFHSARLRHDGTLSAAHVSGAYQTQRPPARSAQASCPGLRNIWMGVSVENAAVVPRIADLQQVPAAVRFLSVEPLLGPIDDAAARGNSLGHCWGRVGAGGASYAGGMGGKHSGAVPRRQTFRFSSSSGAERAKI